MLDVIPAVGERSGQGNTFGALPVSALSQDQLLALLAARERYMATVFDDSIRKLEQDPALSNAPPCVTTEQLAEGTCILPTN